MDCYLWLKEILLNYIYMLYIIDFTQERDAIQSALPTELQPNGERNMPKGGKVPSDISGCSKKMVSGRKYEPPSAETGHRRGCSLRFCRRRGAAAG